MFRRFLDSARKLGFRRRWIALILVFQVASILFEGIGIGIFLPILELITSNKDVPTLAAESTHWRYLVDAFQLVGLQPTLGPLLGAAFIAFLLRQGFMAAKLLVLNAVKFTFMRDVRCQAFRKFLAADLSFHDRVSAGEFANELAIELTSATGALVSYVNYIGQLTICAIYGAGLLLLSPVMTFATFAIFGATAILLSGLMRRSRAAGQQVTRANQSLSKFLLERIRSIRLIRLSAMERAEQESVEKLADRQSETLIHLNKISTLLTVAIEPIILLGGFAVFYLSIDRFGVPPERVMVMFVAIIRLLPVIKETMLRRQVFIGSFASIQTILRRLEEMDHAPERFPAGRTFDGVRDAIRFREVSFSFASGTQALRGVDAEIPARTITAIVGPSGAGKSTLIDLLPRLRHATAGQVTIDGAPIEDYDLRGLRDRIAFVSQFPTVLDMTAAEYIGYGAGSIGQAEIEAAARLANAADFIEALPKKYEEPLGESGNRLSGGQRQRLDLARALARKAALIVLDEPTSNLDAGSERAIVSALERIKNETDAAIVIVAHRPSATLVADHILIMHDGQVAAAGTHAELLQRNAWYRETLHAGGSAPTPIASIVPAAG
ncbi:MAG: ABC transporter ATP-binding protein [Alphaproteobacteria bacterium]